MPYLAAGAVAIAGGAIAEKKWPSYTTRAVIGTIALVIVASATSETRMAPLVRAIGFLLLMTTIMSAVRAQQKRK